MSSRCTTGSFRQGRCKLITEVLWTIEVPTSPYLQPQRLGSAYCQQAWHTLLWSHPTSINFDAYSLDTTRQPFDMPAKRDLTLLTLQRGGVSSCPCYSANHQGPLQRHTTEGSSGLR